MLSGLNAQDSNEWRSAIMQCAPLTSQQGQSRLAAENEHIDLVFGGGGGDGLRTPPSPTQSGGGLGRRPGPPQLWSAQSGEI